MAWSWESAGSGLCKSRSTFARCVRSSERRAFRACTISSCSFMSHCIQFLEGSGFDLLSGQDGTPSVVIERVFEALAQRIRLVELAGFPSVNGLHDQLVAQLLHSMGELAVLGDFAQLVNAFEHQRPAPMCKRIRCISGHAYRCQIVLIRLSATAV